MVQKHRANMKFIVAWKECELLIEYVTGNDGLYERNGTAPENGPLSLNAIAAGNRLIVSNIAKRKPNRADCDLNQLQSLTIKIKITSAAPAPILVATKNSNPNLNVAIALGKTTST